MAVTLAVAIVTGCATSDNFGKRFMIKLNVIPVIQGLVKNPIFGEN